MCEGCKEDLYSLCMCDVWSELENKGLEEVEFTKAEVRRLTDIIGDMIDWSFAVDEAIDTVLSERKEV